MAALEKNNQEDLKANFYGIGRFTEEFDEKIAAGISLADLLSI